LGADAAQEVEAGTGDLRPAGHVDRAEALGDLEVVLDRVVEARHLAHVLAHGEVVLEPLGGALGEVRDLAQRGVADGERLPGLGLEPLDIGGELLDLCQQRLLLLALRLGDLLAEGLLLGARGFERRGGLAPADVRLEHRVHGGGVTATRPLGVTDGFGVLAQVPQIDHCSRVPARTGASTLTRMDLTLLLSVASVVTALVSLVLLVVVLRHLGRHRRELTALKATAQRIEADDRRVTGPERTPADGSSPDGEPEDEPADGDQLRRIAVVLNPSKFEGTAAFRRTIGEVVDRVEGAETVFYETTIDDPGVGQARQAVAEGADLVMAAGGDGTVRMVASVLAGTDTRMGIIPAGTGNLLARNVDIPLEDPAAAMVAALTGRDRQVDVGWLRAGGSVSAARSAERQIFLVIAGFGADAEMIGYTDPAMKKRIGWIAYAVGGIRTVL